MDDGRAQAEAHAAIALTLGVPQDGRHVQAVGQGVGEGRQVDALHLDPVDVQGAGAAAIVEPELEDVVAGERHL
ncbi:MAG: hypothetical protein ACOX2R_03350 [Anaerolineae bacterium]